MYALRNGAPSGQITRSYPANPAPDVAERIDIVFDGRGGSSELPVRGPTADMEPTSMPGDSRDEIHDFDRLVMAARLLPASEVRVWAAAMERSALGPRPSFLEHADDPAYVSDDDNLGLP